MKMKMNWAAALFLVLFTAASVQAADWNFYGSARVSTFYTDTDIPGGSSSTTLTEGLHGNARIGAKVKVSDELKARFEYGASGGSANVRQLWGEWNFGAGKFLVGQTYTPIYTAYSSQAFDEDLGLEKYGTISASRKPMLQLTFGDFKIAAVQPGTKTLSGTSTTEINIPKIEASYQLKLNALTLDMVAGYNAYELDDTYDVTSYIVGLGAELKLGAAYLNGTVFMGQNLGPYGFKNAPADDPVVSGTSLIDNDSMGFTFCAGYKVNDMFSFEAGYGYSEGELDQAGAVEDDAQAYYVQAKITLAPGVYVVPEIGVIDELNDSTGAEQSDTLYYGAKWQINF